MNTSSTNLSVFVSYNSQDRAVVEQVTHPLKRAEVELWMDVEQLLPGDVWPRTLEQVLARSRIALIFLGPHGLGRWQEVEIHAILDQHAHRQCTVIPILLKGSKVPLLLRSFTWFDFTQADSNSINRLLAAIQNCTGAVTNQEGPVARTSFEWALVVGVILAVAGVSHWSTGRFVEEQSAGTANRETAKSGDLDSQQGSAGAVSIDVADGVPEVIVRHDPDISSTPPRLLPESPKWSGLAAVTHTAPDAAALIEQAIRVVESLPMTPKPRIFVVDPVW